MKTMGKEEIKHKFRIEYIVPLVHFFLTFLFERVNFIFEDNFAFVNEVARNEAVSDRFEIVMTYILSKAGAFILIWLLWKGIFYTFSKRSSKSTSILFVSIFLVGVVIGLAIYPNMFSMALDNYLTYAQAIRFLPTYWQSIYTGAVYAACMMVLPHPFAIFLFQWMAYVSVVFYVYTNVEECFNNKNVKYITLLLFVLPETYDVVFDAYRNNFYAMLCMFYFSYLFFSFRKKNKAFSTSEMVILMMLSAFLAVWRSEGILIGVAGVVLLFFAYKVNWKKYALLLLAFVCTFVVTNGMQNIGATKYYGNDYMIINTTDVLRSVLNNPNGYFNYEGAAEDLAAIDAVVPVQVLKESGSTGYRNYNWTEGQLNFNQTLATDEEAKAYMSAYYRIILNNISAYLDVQVNNFFGALQINVRHNTYWYSGEILTDLSSFDYYRWRTGEMEIKESLWTADWETKGTRIFLASVFAWFISAWRELWTGTGIMTILHAAVIILDIVLLAYRFVKLVLEKDKAQAEYVVYFLVIVGELAAVFLFMPVARAAYLYPMLYVSYLILFYNLCEAKVELKIEKNTITGN